MFLCYSYTSNVENEETITGEGANEDNEMDTQGTFSGHPSVDSVQSNHSSEGTTQIFTFCNLLLFCFKPYTW